MMRVAIHQPNYLPWPGYFYKMFKCDIFIFLDDAQYTKNSFINRNRIKTPSGEQWLTVPVHGSLSERINEVKTKDDIWKAKHIKTLQLNYCKAPYFSQYFEDIASIINEPENLISEINMKLIKHIARVLEVPCKFMISSEIGSDKTADDRLIDLIHKVGGDFYLSGKGGANYQSEEKFKANDIELHYYDFKPPQYPQLWKEFIPALSIIDMLFNCGPESRRIMGIE